MAISLLATFSIYALVIFVRNYKLLVEACMVGVLEALLVFSFFLLGVVYGVDQAKPSPDPMLDFNRLKTKITQLEANAAIRAKMSAVTPSEVTSDVSEYSILYKNGVFIKRPVTKTVLLEMRP